MKENIYLIDLITKLLDTCICGGFSAETDINNQVYGMCEVTCRYISLKEGIKDSDGKSMVNVNHIIHVFKFLYDNKMIIHTTKLSPSDTYYKILGIITSLAIKNEGELNKSKPI